MEQSKLVAQRQLSDFFPDGKFSLCDESILESLNHCPLTNLVGDSAFVDFDYDFYRRSNASLINRSAKHVVKKRNNTVEYITKQSPAMKEALFKSARPERIYLKKESREEEESVNHAQRVKFVENQQKRIDKESMGMSKRGKAMDEVHKHGGPCQKAEGVDMLLYNLELQDVSDKLVLETIKSEIRYHKQLMGRSTLKFGSLGFMVSSSKDALLSESPPVKRAKNL